MAVARGRPIGSPIRQNMKKLLEEVGPMTGYDLAKAYNKRFKACTQRSIYYHLQKGVDLGDFAVEKVADEEGEYSWGKSVQKIYYKVVSK